MASTGKNKRAFLRPYIRENKAVFAVYVVLRFIVLACLVLSAVDGDWENVFVCLLVLLLFLVPDFLGRKLKIEFPSLLQIIILLFRGNGAVKNTIYKTAYGGHRCFEFV